MVDEVGSAVPHFAVGDRVFGGAMARAVADFTVVNPAQDELLHTPAGLDDATAATLPVAARTAAAALSAIGLRAGDTVLIGGAAGGVGVLAVQLARLAGARVLGTSSPNSFDFLRELGAEPVAYGEGLTSRVRVLAPDGITAATDLFGTETAYTALELGVSSDRISTIAAHDPDLQVTATGGADSDPGALAHIADLVARGLITVPIAGRFPIDRIREAVTLQASRHARGKVVIEI